jgi:hypothetical protein
LASVLRKGRIMAHHYSHAGEQHEEPEGKICMPEKLLRIVEFWLHHNEEHAQSYRDWADRARKMGFEEVGHILEVLAGEALLSNRNLERVLSLLKDNQPHIDSPKTV